ncbi:unnamed protein product [Rhizoctonia solani]|uniref:Uncharacterized protein n=1 Tax=Rhizoctonia solani TaxID=456999 RepID=A0A8H3EBI4_9AGAM|nr:unnamed protein product [Rhizoctonia solani]CAE7228495.1 unnamed protein product [Rhizoctonia solani]
MNQASANSATKSPGNDLHASHMGCPPQSVVITDSGVKCRESSPNSNTYYHRLNIVIPSTSSSGSMLRPLKRQALDLLKVVMDNLGIVRMAGLGKLEGTLESEEARFQSHLDAVSGISRTLIGKRPSEQYDLSAPNYDPSELQSFIDSMRSTLREGTSVGLPYSRLLAAEQRQRQLYEATGMFQNWINEFTLNSVLVQSSYGSMLENKMKALEEKMLKFDQRIQALEDKLLVMNAGV